jgi:hypothetical protein
MAERTEGGQMCMAPLSSSAPLALDLALVSVQERRTKGRKIGSLHCLPEPRFLHLWNGYKRVPISWWCCEDQVADVRVWGRAST